MQRMTSVTNRKRRRKIWTSFVQGRRECNTRPIKPGAGHATSANRNRKPHRRTLQHDLHSAASEPPRSGGSKFASNPKPALWGHFRRNRAVTKAGAPTADCRRADGRWPMASHPGRQSSARVAAACADNGPARPGKRTAATPRRTRVGARLRRHISARRRVARPCAARRLYSGRGRRSRTV